MARSAELTNLAFQTESLLLNFGQIFGNLATALFANFGLNSENFLNKLPFKKTTGAGESWQSLSYLQNKEQAKNPDQLMDYMSLELRTYFDEYVALELVKNYPNFGPKGIDNLAPNNLVKISEQTRDHLLQNGFDTTRAELEITAMQKILTFLADDSIPNGSALAYISPRGPKYMYLGYELTNNNYINLYIKTGHNQAMLVQLLNYDLNDSLINEFLTFLEKNQQASLYQPGQTSLLNQLGNTTLSDEHFLINNLMLIPAKSFNLDAIITQSFKNSASWKTQISDFPQFNHQAYLKQEQNLLALFRELVLPILNNDSENIEAENSPNVQKIDYLVKIMKQHFQKWTEENATNYHAERQQNQQNKTQLNLNDIKLEWQLACKKLSGENLNQQEQQKAKQLKNRYQLNPSLPLLNLSKLNFCLPMPRFSQNLNLSMGKGLTNLKGPELAKFLKKQNYVTLKLAGKDWKVPAEYLKGKGCYEKNGVAYGPCDIALDKDPYALKLKDMAGLNASHSPSAKHKTTKQTEKNSSNDQTAESKTLVNVDTFINSLFFGDALDPLKQMPKLAA